MTRDAGCSRPSSPGSQSRLVRRVDVPGRASSAGAPMVACGGCVRDVVISGRASAGVHRALATSGRPARGRLKADRTAPACRRQEYPRRMRRNEERSGPRPFPPTRSRRRNGRRRISDSAGFARRSRGASVCVLIVCQTLWAPAVCGPARTLSAPGPGPWPRGDAKGVIRDSRMTLANTIAIARKPRMTIRKSVVASGTTSLMLGTNARREFEIAITRRRPDWMA